MRSILMNNGSLNHRDLGIFGKNEELFYIQFLGFNEEIDAKYFDISDTGL